MRWDKEPSVAQLISSWLRLHGRAVSNLINTSPQTSHAASWLPTSTPTHPRRRMVCVAIKQKRIPATFQHDAAKKEKNSECPGLQFLHIILLALPISRCDATIVCSERRFLAGFVCPETIPPWCWSRRAVHLVVRGTLTMAAFVQLRGTEPAGLRSNGHAAQQSCVRCQSTHPEAAVATWRGNAAKAICTSKQNYQFEAKSADRWRGRSVALAAALAAAAASTAASDTVSLDSHF